MFNKLTILIIIFLAITAVLGLSYWSARQELAEARAVLAERETSGEITGFLRMFIEKILKAEGEVSFETRLQLETKVRELNDGDILESWQKFVNSATELEAQGAVKELLEKLAGKIK